MRDFSQVRVTLTIQTLVIVALFVVGGVMSLAFGYFRLDAKASAGAIAAQTLKMLQCDVRQLKLFMLYGVKPDPQLERCDSLPAPLN